MDFHLDYSPFSLKVFSSQLCCAGLLVIDSLLWIAWKCLHFAFIFEGYFHWLEHFGLTGWFPFSTFKMLFHCFRWEVSGDAHCCSHRCNDSFSLILRFLLFILDFQQFDYIVPGHHFSFFLFCFVFVVLFKSMGRNISLFGKMGGHHLFKCFFFSSLFSVHEAPVTLTFVEFMFFHRSLILLLRASVEQFLPTHFQITGPWFCFVPSALQSIQ